MVLWLQGQTKQNISFHEEHSNPLTTFSQFYMILYEKIILNK